VGHLARQLRVVKVRNNVFAALTDNARLGTAVPPTQVALEAMEADAAGPLHGGQSVADLLNGDENAARIRSELGNRDEEIATLNAELQVAAAGFHQEPKDRAIEATVFQEVIQRDADSIALLKQEVTGQRSRIEALERRIDLERRVPTEEEDEQTPSHEETITAPESEQRTRVCSPVA
jgi:hypothetical protein